MTTRWAPPSQVHHNLALLEKMGPFNHHRSTSRSGKILLALGTATAFLALIWGFLPHQPFYRGLRLDQWLDAFNQVGSSVSNSQVNQPASKAIRAMGTNSLPFLLKHLLHHDSILAQKFFDLAARQHLFKLPVHQDYPYYAPSVFALTILGPEGSPHFARPFKSCPGLFQ